MTLFAKIGIGFGVLVAVLVVFVLVRFSLFGAESRAMTPELGVSSGQLTDCPASPNCVSSMTASEKHKIEPFTNEFGAFEKLISAIEASAGATIQKKSAYYLHATYQSGLFGFVDDLEFWVAEDAIHVRSASRVGYSDLDANRKRVESLRQAVAQ